MMKKKFAAFGFLSLMASTSLAMATSFSWIDTVKNNVVFNTGALSSYTFTYNITGIGGGNVLTDPLNPFIAGTDHVDSADLLLNFSATGKGSTKTAHIVLDGSTRETSDFSFNLTSSDDIILGTAIVRLDSFGTLLLSITDVKGEFTLADSILTAQGTDNSFSATPVPEPGTMILLGAGLLGLAIHGKRRKSLA